MGGGLINQAQTEERHSIEVNLKMKEKGDIRGGWNEEHWLGAIFKFHPTPKIDIIPKSTLIFLDPA